VGVFHEQENEIIPNHLTKFAAPIANLNLYRSNLGFWHDFCGTLPAGNSHSSPRLDYVSTIALKNIKILLISYTAPNFVEETNIIIQINIRV